MPPGRTSASLRPRGLRQAPLVRFWAEPDLLNPVRKRRRTTPYSEPFAEVTAPNQLWCMDFKGWFRTEELDGLEAPLVGVPAEQL